MQKGVLREERCTPQYWNDQDYLFKTRPKAGNAERSTTLKYEECQIKQRQ